MNEGQITGQRVEIRTKGIQGNPDIVQLGTVIGLFPSGAAVQTDKGRITLVDYPMLAIDGSATQQIRIEEATERVRDFAHAKGCGPLCREHGDPRDTNMAEPVAVMS